MKPPLSNDDVEALARELEQYVAQHPDAADTSEGVAQWWVDQRDAMHVSRVEDALELLVARGVLERREAAGGQSLYARAPRQPGEPASSEPARLSLRPTYPGVYVEEVASGVRVIEGVATSVTLFVGWATKGSVDAAVRVTSFADFEREYGALDARALLGYSVRHFFDNGGAEAYVVRVSKAGDEGAVLAPGDGAFEAAVLAAFAEGAPADRIDLYNLVCVPGLTDAATIAALATRCAARRAFLLADCPAGATALTVPNALPHPLGAAGSHCGFYFPWVLAPDPLVEGAAALYPPCGFVAGVYARTDARRGVWKAPAGAETVLRGALGLEVLLGDAESGALSAAGINCLRSFPRSGLVVWGARTLEGHDRAASEWKYVPVRRLALFIEESLSRGTRWAALETNGEPLWAQIRLSVNAFLHALFRQGAFQGATPREAYFVKCDRSTMTQADLDGGILNLEVGFASLKPAEFVVLRIRQNAVAPG